MALQIGTLHGVLDLDTGPLDKKLAQLDQSVGRSLQSLSSDGKKLERSLADAGAQGAQLGNDLKSASSEGSRALGTVEDAAKKADHAIGGIDLKSLAGGAALAGLVGTFDDATVSAGKLKAQMGLSADEAHEFDGVAKKVYRDNFGESMQHAAGVTAQVAQSLHLTGDALVDATEDVFRISDAFGDWGADTRIITEDVRAMKAAFPGESEHELLGRITKAFQSGAGSAGDLQDTLQEYPAHFAAIGLSASDMTNFLVEGMSAGARNTDLLADAVKEFGIRVKTAGDTGQVAIRQMFPPDEAERLIGDFSRGGDAARDAFYEVVQGLSNVQDPQDRYNTAIALFGTKAEDLVGVLDDMAPGFLATKDATDDASDATSTLDAQYAGFGATLEGMKRKLQTSILGPLESVGGVAMSAVQGVGSVGAGLMGLKSIGIDVLGTVTKHTDGLKGSLGSLGGMVGAGGPLVVGLGVGLIALNEWSRGKEEAKRRTDEFVVALRADSGELGDNTKSLILNRLEQANQTDDLARAGVKMKDVTKAVEGDTRAREALIKRLEDEGELNDGLKLTLFALFQQHDKAVIKEKDRTKVLGEEAAATEAVTGATDDATGALTTGTAALDENRHATSLLTSQLDELLTSTLAQFNADLAYQSQTNRVEDALADLNDKTAEVMKTKGADVKANEALERSTLEAASAVLGQAAAAVEAAKQQATLSGKTLSAQDAARIQREELGKVAATLAPDSPLRKQLDAYIYTLGAIPKTVKTTIEQTFVSRGNDGGVIVRKDVGSGGKGSLGDLAPIDDPAPVRLPKLPDTTAGRSVKVDTSWGRLTVPAGISITDQGRTFIAGQKDVPGWAGSLTSRAADLVHAAPPRTGSSTVNHINMPVTVRDRFDSKQELRRLATLVPSVSF